MKKFLAVICLTVLMVFGGVVGASENQSGGDLINCCLRGCT